MSNDTVNELLAQSPVQVEVQGKAEVSLAEAVNSKLAQAHTSRVRSFIKGTLRDKALMSAFAGAEDAQEQAIEYFEFAYRPKR